MRTILLVAILPAAVLLFFIYKKDRLEKESAGLLLKLLGFGAVCAIPASLLESVGSALLNSLELESGILYYAVLNYLVIALAEEGCKFLMLKKFTWKSPEFDCSYDGIIYAVYVSLGFAILENIMYVFNYGITNGLYRAVTAVPGHCFFGVFMGVSYSRAKAADHLGNTAAAKSFRIRGLLTAVLVHGTYDFLLTLGGDTCTCLFYVLLAGMYIFGFGAVKRASAEDRYIRRENAFPDVSQWV